jgi:hypothetical protein
MDLARAMTKNFLARLQAGALIGVIAACAVAAAPADAQSPAPSDAKMRVAQGFFERLFGPLPGGRPMFAPEPQRPVDSSRAPPPRKPETPPTSTVMVIGDSLADWLAYGLEEALVDTPEIGVVRKTRIGSGLIRYDPRNEQQEWAPAIREMLAAEKPQYVVMMVGLHDRQSIRVREGQARRAAPQAERPQDQEAEPENAEQANQESQRARTPGVYEFQSERWEEIYIRRIDDAIAALKSRNVPVFWVGLPSLRGTKATAEATYLNELFRTRAERAGIVYVDIWDGFVDEQNRFTLQGPDYEGQNRRLRSSDGLHFTRPGARKLAHFLEREINRVAPLQAAPVALPEPQQQAPSVRPGGPTARPLSGPAVPLEPYARAGEELIDTNPSRTDWASKQADHVLVRGEPMTAPAGRADDFVWPRRGVAPFGSDPVVVATTMPVPLAQLPPPPPKVEPAAKTASRQQLAPAGQLQTQGPPRAPPRPSVFNPFGFLGGLFR